ncbi:UDP-3-O-acyl-N-acetylglucosamine deacetylase [Salinisphaera sp. USBA-960]|uniref:UDP-3-O-acyl-N-acetylglucosamine deacetylase n=1 Tax=Salinisphaera orenii TaxID=856731 RepID=UPI000DBE252C|nr:UDP-3-O-acyl-N-acetylglucosamine deacetylase [Salifodinibacter halophilus]NNC26753.1 UDP-3-O-acyl-N-acetylglucosamine deacetylase [Salifodinibacter halophilus]
MIQQRTLQNPISASGVGLHSGVVVDLTLWPAPVDHGIVFRRTDLAEPVDLPVQADCVGDTHLATTLVRDVVTVKTVEHLLAALAGLGIDNVRIDITAPEVPIMDGSAGPFVFLIQSAGIQAQPDAKRFVRVCRSTCVTDGDKWAQLEPAESFEVDCSLDFDHPVLAAVSQAAHHDFAVTSFVREVSRARTFGFLSELEAMRAADLARGGGTHNAVVLDDDAVVNQEGLRYADEFVRHKILDAVGDLYLLGHGLIGRYTAFKSGHGLNNRLLRALLADPTAWEIVSAESVTRSPMNFGQTPAANVAA